MKLLVLLVLVLAGAWFLIRIAQAGVKVPDVGQAAPGFSLVDQQGTVHRLQDYRGQWLVLYFYPKDDTPVCTKEACAFRDGYRELRALQVNLLGLSLDDAQSHAEFAAKHHLPFPLLADPDAEVAAAYGALWSFGPIRFTQRYTFIINPEGLIAKVYRKVDAQSHAGEVLRDVRALMGV